MHPIIPHPRIDDPGHIKGVRTVATLEFTKGMIVVLAGLGVFSMRHKDIWGVAESFLEFFHANPHHLIARGVKQRVLALEAFLADVYGPRHAFADGVLPWRVVCTSTRFHREVTGLEPPNGVRCHVSGIDLVRDGAGKVRVLEDNVRIPSGVSYVIENRLAMTRTFPALFSEQHVHPVYSY